MPSVISGDGTTVVSGARYFDGTAGSNTGCINVRQTGFPVTGTQTDIFFTLESNALTIASNNSDITKATIGDEVTISYTYDLSVNTPMIDISCGTATTGISSVKNAITTTADDSTYTSWTSKFIVDASDNDGPFTFAIDASSLT